MNSAFISRRKIVVVREGKRVFLPAGEEQGGIARSAVFTHEDMIAAPGNSVTTQVTITIPTAPGSRAIACIFMGKSLLSTSTSVTMTASLGALVTFNLGSNYRLESQPMQVQVDSDAKTLTFHEQVTNSGSDPKVPQGVYRVDQRARRISGAATGQWSAAAAWREHCVHGRASRPAQGW